MHKRLEDFFNDAFAILNMQIILKYERKYVIIYLIMFTQLKYWQIVLLNSVYYLEKIGKML